MRGNIRAIGEICMELLYPRKCIFCGRVITMKSYRGIIREKSYDFLCKDCKEDIKKAYIEEPYCLKCGKQLDNMTQEYCVDCRRLNHIYDRGLSVFKYHDRIKESVYRFKYKDCKCYGEFYGEQMAEKYKEIIKKWQPNAIIPVPIHKARMRKRGYNQAELIGRALAKKINIPLDVNVLFRDKKTEPQKKLSKEIRIKNLENAFKVSTNVVRYNKIILVDDIYTTGATINACARVLKQAGVQEVYFISICIGEGI